MSISLKIDKKLRNFSNEYTEKRIQTFYAKVATQLPYVIASTIQKGISPVEGIGRFKQYSASYVEQIERVRKGDVKDLKLNERRLKKGQDAIDGRSTSKSANKLRGKLRSPVNMSVTGAMVGSITGLVTAKNVIIKFTSDIAKYHNGQGRVDRHILPKDGESFSSLIMKKLRDLLKESFK